MSYPLDSFVFFFIIYFIVRKVVKIFYQKMGNTKFKKRGDDSFENDFNEEEIDLSEEKIKESEDDIANEPDDLLEESLEEHIAKEISGMNDEEEELI